MRTAANEVGDEWSAIPARNFISVEKIWHGRKHSLVSLDGPLRFPPSGELQRHIEAILVRAERRIVLDLSRVARIDAAGVGELVGAYNATTAAHGVLRIVHATDWVREILERVGLFALLSGRDRSERPWDGHSSLMGSRISPVTQVVQTERWASPVPSRSRATSSTSIVGQPADDTRYLFNTPISDSSPVPFTPSKDVGAGTIHVPLPVVPLNRPVPPVTWKSYAATSVLKQNVPSAVTSMRSPSAATKLPCFRIGPQPSSNRAISKTTSKLPLVWPR